MRVADFSDDDMCEGGILYTVLQTAAASAADKSGRNEAKQEKLARVVQETMIEFRNQAARRPEAVHQKDLDSQLVNGITETR